MMQTQLPWQDRFTTPQVETLRDGLPAEAMLFFDRIRQTARSVEGVAERVQWYGINWCWSIEYRINGDGTLLAVLIPSPTDFQLAIPVDTTFIGGLPYRRLKRGIRDGLDLARAPFDTRWAVWSVTQAHMLDDLDDLLGRWERHLKDSRTAPAESRRSRSSSRSKARD